MQINQPAQADLFAAENNALANRLKSVEPDTLSPRDALALLYELKELEKASS